MKINPDLAAMIERMDADPAFMQAVASDDQGRSVLVEAFAKMSDDQAIDLAEAINERASQVEPGDGKDLMIARLAMFGWAMALEAVRERMRNMDDDAGDAAD